MTVELFNYTSTCLFVSFASVSVPRRLSWYTQINNTRSVALGINKRARAATRVFLFFRAWCFVIIWLGPLRPRTFRIPPGRKSGNTRPTRNRESRSGSAPYRAGNSPETRKSAPPPASTPHRSFFWFLFTLRRQENSQIWQQWLV